MLWSAVNFGSSTAICVAGRPIPVGQFQPWSISSKVGMTFASQNGRVLSILMVALLRFFSCFWPQNSAMSILFVWEFEAQFWSFQLPPPWPLIKWLKAELNQIVIHMEDIIPRGGIHSGSIDEVIGWCVVSLDALSWDRHTKRSITLLDPLCPDRP